ncbi:TPA: hypothetical protein ACHXG2_004780 [Escherichia coli]|nr:hypothetical protein [Escherichia coli]
MKKMLFSAALAMLITGLGFITLGIYTPLEARVYCSQ